MESGSSRKIDKMSAMLPHAASHLQTTTHGQGQLSAEKFFFTTLPFISFLIACSIEKYLFIIVIIVY